MKTPWDTNVVPDSDDDDDVLATGPCVMAWSSAPPQADLLLVGTSAPAARLLAAAYPSNNRRSLTAQDGSLVATAWSVGGATVAAVHMDTEGVEVVVARALRECGARRVVVLSSEAAGRAGRVGTEGGDLRGLLGSDVGAALVAGASGGEEATVFMGGKAGEGWAAAFDQAGMPAKPANLGIGMATSAIYS